MTPLGIQRRSRGSGEKKRTDNLDARRPVGGRIVPFVNLPQIDYAGWVMSGGWLRILRGTGV
jgi:hypothetical protein